MPEQTTEEILVFHDSFTHEAFRGRLTSMDPPKYPHEILADAISDGYFERHPEEKALFLKRGGRINMSVWLHSPKSKMPKTIP